MFICLSDFLSMSLKNLYVFKDFESFLNKKLFSQHLNCQQDKLRMWRRK